jgi:hypothetical protein
MNAMTTPMMSADAPVRQRWIRFSLRSILFIMMLVATYMAGWVSHRAWHNRNLQENIVDAMDQLNNSQVSMETVDDLGVTIVKGRKSNVKKAQTSIGKVHDAAKR